MVKFLGYALRSHTGVGLPLTIFNTTGSQSLPVATSSPLTYNSKDGFPFLSGDTNRDGVIILKNRKHQQFLVLKDIGQKGQVFVTVLDYTAKVIVTMITLPK